MIIFSHCSIFTRKKTLIEDEFHLITFYIYLSYVIFFLSHFIGRVFRKPNCYLSIMFDCKTGLGINKSILIEICFQFSTICVIN